MAVAIEDEVMLVALSTRNGMWPVYACISPSVPNGERKQPAFVRLLNDRSELVCAEAGANQKNATTAIDRPRKANRPRAQLRMQKEEYERTGDESQIANGRA
jgi:hypothetical protein